MSKMAAMPGLARYCDRPLFVFRSSVLTNGPLLGTLNFRHLLNHLSKFHTTSHEYSP